MAFDSQSLDYEPVRRSRHPQTGETVKAVEEGFARGPAVSHHEPTHQPEPVRGEAERPEPTVTADDTKSETWSLKRGHAFSFAALFLYTAIAYFRPYELSSALLWTAWLPYWLAIVMLVIFIPTQFALEGNLTTRPREVNVLLLLCLIAVLSIPQAISPEMAWNTFNTVLFKSLIVFIVMVNAMRTEGRLRAMIFLALGAGCFMSASALMDFAAGSTRQYAERASAAIYNMFGEPNSLALHLVTMIPLAVALLLGTRNLAKKLIFGAGILLMLTGIFATESRGGFLALLAAGLVLVWKLGRRRRLAALGLIGAGVLAAVFLAPGGYRARMASIIDPSLDLAGSASARQALLTKSLWVGITSPFLGVGIGNLQIILIHDQVSHNSYTQVAGEMGLVALVLYMMFMIVPYKRLRQIERENLDKLPHSRFYFLAIGLQASLAGYMVGSFFLSVAYDWYVYFLVGYAVCLRRIYATQTPGSGAVTPKVTEPLQLEASSPRSFESPLR